MRDDEGQDTATKLAEITVGQEPRYVALSPDDQEAYVTNSASGTVSVIALSDPKVYTVVDEIPVGAEPRGCAVTPNGRFLLVANHTGGTVSVIRLASRKEIDKVKVGGNPTAVAITNDGDNRDGDERVFVTQFFAELISNGPGEAFDDGKQGMVHSFKLSNLNVSRVTLSPLADVGFTADRTNFCPQTAPDPNALHSDIFCPDSNAAPGSDAIINDPQCAFPNQLQSALIRGNLLFLPNIGAGPEPPVKFNVNVQALVHVVDVKQRAERTDLHVNLNAQIKDEIQPANPTESLDRLFGNDLVAIDGNVEGSEFLIVSRGGNYVIRAKIGAEGQLDIGYRQPKRRGTPSDRKYPQWRGDEP